MQTEQDTFRAVDLSSAGAEPPPEGRGPDRAGEPYRPHQSRAYALLLDTDAHVHTAFGAGVDSIGAVVTAAERVGLVRVTIGDQAGEDATWLPAYQASIIRAQRRTEVELRAAVEVEVARANGWLAFPPDLGGLDAISVAVSRLPMSSGLVDPARVKTMLADQVLSPADVVDILVSATARAVERASRYAPTQLARPLHLLSVVGIDDAEIDEHALRPLVHTCRVTRTAVEVSEAGRVPSVRIARLFAAEGVRLVAASDARNVNQLGWWPHSIRVQSGLYHPGAGGLG